MVFIPIKQKNKQELVKSKAILVKLKLIIGAGSATMTPPLGPILGQYGINIMEFCKEYNDETKDFEKGLALRVTVWVNVMKNFYFEIQGPIISIILKEFYKNEFINNEKIFIEKNKLLKDCFKIAILILSFNKGELKWQSINEEVLKIKVKEILGTCRSCKIYVKE